MKRRDFLSATGTMAAFGVMNGGNGTQNAQASPKSEKKRKKFGGVIPVTVTPYLKNHEIDPTAMTSMSAQLSASGCDGIFVAGSTGDMPFLSIPERETLVKAARKGMAAETVLYAGIGDFSLDDHIENAQRFADAGADAAVVMAPIIFFTVSQEELTAFFREIADKSPIPIVLYHHMRVTTVIEPETVTNLVDHPNIIGMKETGATIDRTLKMLKMIGKRDDFFLLQGREAFLADSYAAGCDGCVAALAGPAPEPFVALNQAWEKGDQATFEKNVAEVDRLCGLFDIMPPETISYFSYTLKKMMEYRGWLDSSFVRLPGFEPSPEYDAKLQAKLEEFNFPKK